MKYEHAWVSIQHPRIQDFASVLLVFVLASNGTCHSRQILFKKTTDTLTMSLQFEGIRKRKEN